MVWHRLWLGLQSSVSSGAFFIHRLASQGCCYQDLLHSLQPSTLLIVPDAFIQVASDWLPTDVRGLEYLTCSL
jgi:hypothetical protein